MGTVHRHVVMDADRHVRVDVGRHVVVAVGADAAYEARMSSPGPIRTVSVFVEHRSESVCPRHYIPVAMYLSHALGCNFATNPSTLQSTN